MSESKLPTEFGIFYPTGWIVAAFPGTEPAQKARRDLLTGGYDEQDCRLFGADEVIPSGTKALEDSGWLARLGKADELVAKHVAAAQRGAAFLVVHAPTQGEADRVMNVVRRGQVDFVHRYHRFAIETLK